MDTSVLNPQKQLTDVRDGYYTITSKGHTVRWVWSLWLWLLYNYFIIIVIFFFFQKFLNDFGYVSFSRSGNHDVSTAIRMFQEYFGLRVSGILDASTVNLMKKPRCGVPDANEGVRMQRYATLGKWSKKNLNYFVQPGQDLPHVSYKRIVFLFLFCFVLFCFFTSVGLKSSPNDVPVVLGDDVFFLLCFVFFFFFVSVLCFCFRLLSLLLMLDVLILMLIVHFHSYSYFHSHFPSLFHSHYDYHYHYLYRYGYRYHS